MNMLMTFVELAGLLIVHGHRIYYIAQGNADFGVLTQTDISVTTAARRSPCSPASRSPSSR